MSEEPTLDEILFRFERDLNLLDGMAVGQHHEKGISLQRQIVQNVWQHLKALTALAEREDYIE
jgi:hypothetical protein